MQCSNVPMLILLITNTVFTEHEFIVFLLQGLKRFNARKVILDALTSKGLFIKTDDNQMVVPVCR